MTPGIDDAKAEVKSYTNNRIFATEEKVKSYTNSEDKKLEAKMEASHASQGKHVCVISRQPAKQPPSLRVPLINPPTHALQI